MHSKRITFRGASEKNLKFMEFLMYLMRVTFEVLVEKLEIRVLLLACGGE